MLSEVEGEIKQTRASNINRLLKVVICQEYEKVEDFKFLYLKYNGQTPDKDTIERECPSWNNRYIIAQTFTAMSLEAFYYDYVVEKESKTKADSNTPPLIRFEYLAQTYLKQTKIKDSDLFKKLKALNILRRHWVHHKSTNLGNYSNPEIFFTPSECIELLVVVLSLFEEYDKSYLLSSVTKKHLVSVQENVKDAINSITVSAT